MSIILRDLPALARARRSGTTLASEKTSGGGTPVPAPGPDVGTALEALRAVIPTTLITLYSTGVILLQNLAIAAGASDRATEQAALATKFGPNTEALKTALEGLSVEPPTLAWARIVFAVVSTLLVLFWAYQKSQVEGKGSAKLEPAVVTGAFIAWAIASPGTFLAAYLSATQLAVTTILVAFLSAIALFVLGETVLKKKTG